MTDQTLPLANEAHQPIATSETVAAALAAPDHPTPEPRKPTLDDCAQRAWEITDLIYGIVAAIAPQSSDAKLLKAREHAVKSWQSATTAAQLLGKIAADQRKNAK